MLESLRNNAPRNHSEIYQCGAVTSTTWLSSMTVILKNQHKRILLIKTHYQKYMQILKISNLKNVLNIKISTFFFSPYEWKFMVALLNVCVCICVCLFVRHILTTYLHFTYKSFSIYINYIYISFFFNADWCKCFTFRRPTLAPICVTPTTWSKNMTVIPKNQHERILLIKNFL